MRSHPLRIAVGITGILVVCIGAITFMLDGSPTGIDDAVMSWFVAHRGGTATTIITQITLVFGPVSVTAWTAIAALGFFIRDRVLTRAVALIATVAVAGALGEVAKLIVSRHRPPALDQLGVLEMTYSYPSGHVTGTTALVCALVVLVTDRARRSTRMVAWFLATVVVVVAAGTRLYLGVHWVSDVVAGAALGVAVGVTVTELSVAVLARFGPHEPSAARKLLPGAAPGPDAARHRAVLR
ncbi:phosphatase PAP2 family protein [Gordonia sp. NPDC003376]